MTADVRAWCALADRLHATDPVVSRDVSRRHLLEFAEKARCIQVAPPLRLRVSCEPKISSARSPSLLSSPLGAALPPPRRSATPARTGRAATSATSGRS